jgi:hypothetical protein
VSPNINFSQFDLVRHGRKILKQIPVSYIVYDTNVTSETKRREEGGEERGRGGGRGK